MEQFGSEFWKHVENERQRVNVHEEPREQRDDQSLTMSAELNPGSDGPEPKPPKKRRTPPSSDGREPKHSDVVTSETFPVVKARPEEPVPVEEPVRVEELAENNARLILGEDYTWRINVLMTHGDSTKVLNFVKSFPLTRKVSGLGELKISVDAQLGEKTIKDISVERLREYSLRRRQFDKMKKWSL